MGEHTAEGWFLVQVKPNAHNVAERNLKRQGFSTFLPLHQTTQRQGTRFVNQLRPLFPGYMFVRLSPAASPWRKVNSTYGVSRIVSFGDSPALVPPALVTGLLDRCEPSGGVLVNNYLLPGEPVRVIAGPFSEFVAIVETIDADRRVWLLLEFMGQMTRIQVRPDQVVSR